MKHKWNGDEQYQQNVVREVSESKVIEQFDSERKEHKISGAENVKMLDLVQLELQVDHQSKISEEANKPIVADHIDIGAINRYCLYSIE
jgi:hypothetical protein